MKKVALWIICIILTIFVLDVAFGKLFAAYMDKSTLPGDYEMTDHVLRDFNEDIAVLGSSVALNSINTKTIQDSLGVSTFNGAANGQAFPFYLSMLKAIIAQHPPKRVVLGLIPENLVDSGIGVRYNFLSPYYGRGLGDIDSNLESDGELNRFFLKSNFYRLNRIWFRIFLYNFVQAGIKGENGFIAKPLPPQFPEKYDLALPQALSAERRSQLNEFLELCKENNIDLTVVLTPRYFSIENTETPAVEEIRRLCSNQGFRFFNDSQLPPFSSDSSLFYDRNHININGAAIYTDTIIQRLK